MAPVVQTHPDVRPGEAEAPVVQTRPGAAKDPVFLTHTGAGQALLVQTRPGAAQASVVQMQLTPCDVIVDTSRPAQAPVVSV